MHTSKRKPAEAGFLLTGPQSGIPFLHQRNGVADDQTVLVDILIAVIAAAIGTVTPFDTEVLQGAFLENVADVGVTLPFFAIPASTKVVAGYIASHEGQARNAHGSEVVIIARLPGLFVRVGKACAQHYIVDQEWIGAGACVGKAGITTHFLIAETKAVAA